VAGSGRMRPFRAHAGRTSSDPVLIQAFGARKRKRRQSHRFPLGHCAGEGGTFLRVDNRPLSYSACSILRPGKPTMDAAALDRDVPISRRFPHPAEHSVTKHGAGGELVPPVARRAVPSVTKHGAEGELAPPVACPTERSVTEHDAGRVFSPSAAIRPPTGTMTIPRGHAARPVSYPTPSFSYSKHSRHIKPKQ
jgi:hypothetical protein